jgi:mono/diheme cytochrome c family protein
MVLRCFAYCSIFFLLVACSSGNLSEKESKKSAPKVAGEELFEMNCAICHGLDGTANVSGAKDLSVSQLSTAEIMKIIKNGKNGMPPMPEIAASKQKMQEIVEYVKGLRK